MPKKEQASSRKPVKARGALPAPVTAPKRVEVTWYKRRQFQVAIVFGAIFLAVLAFNVIRDLREGSREEKLQVRSIQQFERKLQLLNAPLTEVYQSLQTSTEQFVAGTVAAEEYRRQADGWVEEFRKLYVGIKETEVRAGLDSLLEAKALFTQGAVVLLDGAKIFQQASSTEGPAREASISLGRNLLAHGGAIIGMGERRIQEAKNDFDLNDPPAELPEPVIPEEEAPVPAPTALDPGAVPPPAADPTAPATPAPGAANTAPTAPATPAPGVVGVQPQPLP
jgi:hypothetical protein